MRTETLRPDGRHGQAAGTWVERSEVFPRRLAHGTARRSTPSRPSPWEGEGFDGGRLGHGTGATETG